MCCRLPNLGATSRGKSAFFGQWEARLERGIGEVGAVTEMCHECKVVNRPASDGFPFAKMVL